MKINDLNAMSPDDRNKLESLKIDKNDIRDNGMNKLDKILEDFKNIKSLDLEESGIDNSFSDVKKLATALKNNKTLKILNFKGNEIKDGGVIELAEILNTTVLEDLNLCHCVISDRGVEALSEALKSNTTLKTLNLNNNEISHQGAGYLASAIGAEGVLETLSLDNNEIGDIGFSAIAVELLNNETLKDLSVKNSGVRVVGLRQMENALKSSPGNKTLKTLCLDGLDDVREEAKKNIAKSRKK